MKTLRITGLKNLTPRLSLRPVSLIAVLAAALLGGASTQASSLIWSGPGTTTNWDNGASADWLNGGSASVFTAGDDVLFDNTATCFTPKITAVVVPNSVTVNAANDYTFGGSGSISGATGLTKTGNGTLFLNNASSLTGPVIINGGTVKLGATLALGPVSANYIYLTNNGSLNLNRLSAGPKTIALAGAGYNGAGCLYDSSTLTTPSYEVTNLVLLGDATIASSGRWDMVASGATFTGNGFNLTKIGTGQAWLSPTGGLPNLGNVDIVAGVLGIRTVTDLGDPTKTITVESGASLTLWGNPQPLNKNLVMNHGTISSGLSGSQNNNVFIGPVALTLTNTFSVGSAHLTISNVISGTGGFTKSGNSNLWLYSGNTYTGPTFITGGKFILGANASIDSSSLIQVGSSTSVTLDVSAVPTGLNRSAGQFLTSANKSETILGSVTAGAGSTINVGNGNAGLLTVGQLAMSGCTNVMALGSNPGDLTGATSSIIQDDGSLTLSGTNTFLINPLGPLSTTTPYTVLQYSGSFTGDLTNLSVVTSSPLYTFTFLDPNITAPYLQIQASGAPQTLVWKGGAVSGPNVWDQGTTNWLNTVTSQFDRFYNSDPVIFDDSATTNVVNVTEAVAASMTFNNAILNYTLAGAGSLAGTLDQEGTGTVTLGLSSAPLLTGIANNAGTLVLKKAGTSSYTIGAAISDNGNGLGSIIQAGGNTVQLTADNTGYSGTLAVTNGILQYNNAAALAAPASTLYATNGGTLDMAHVTPGLKYIAISGAGYNGVGALIDSSTTTTPSYEVANLTLVGDATIGSSGRWDNASGGRGSVAGNGFTLTKVGSGQAWFAYVGETGFGDIHVVAGTLGFGHTITMGNPTNTVTVESGAWLTLWGVPGMIDKVMVLNNNASVNAGLTAPESAPNFAGPVTLVGTNTLATASAGLHFWNTFSGTGGFIKTGTSNLWLHGANTYTGPTILNPSSGTLVVDTNSSLGASSLIQIGSGTTLDVSAPVAFNLGSGQTLCGNGTVIGGNINFGPGATLAAGLPGSAVFTLTMSGNLTLLSGSTNLVKVNKTTSVANDQVVGLTSVSLSGTLVISSLGNALAGGDAIPLFSAGTVSGGFSNIIPAVPGAGLGWDTSTLDSDGNLRVVTTVNLTPTNLVTQLADNQLTLSWPPDHIGWHLQAQTNAPGVGLTTNWVEVAGSSATNLMSFPLSPANGSVFYRMVYP